jgi:hypothetical protein
MSFNLFGPATKCDIRVGYIDPERGFVGNLSVYDANKYAKLNPGTTFIFRRRDKIQFMNEKTFYLQTQHQEVKDVMV